MVQPPPNPRIDQTTLLLSLLLLNGPQISRHKPLRPIIEGQHLQALLLHLQKFPHMLVLPILARPIQQLDIDIQIDVCRGWPL